MEKCTGRKTTGEKEAAVKPNCIKEYMLRIYIAGETEKSRRAISNLREICEEHLKGRYDIEVIDLMKNPQLAAGDQILAVPTVVRKLPPPVKKLIGDLSAREKVLVGLDIRPKKDKKSV